LSLDMLITMVPRETKVMSAFVQIYFYTVGLLGALWLSQTNDAFEAWYKTPQSRSL